MLATADGQNDAIAALIAAKANREARTRSGIRPLDIAAERSDTADDAAPARRHAGERRRAPVHRGRSRHADAPPSRAMASR